MFTGTAGTYTDIANCVVTANLGTYNGGTKTTAILADATGSVNLFNLSHSLNGSSFIPVAGDSWFTTTATTTVYQGGAEVTSESFTNFATGAPVTIPSLTVAQFDASDNGSYGIAPYSDAIVTLDDVSFSAGTTTLAGRTNYAISDGTGSGILYTQIGYSSVASAVAAANSLEGSTGTLYSQPVDITGYVSPFYGTAELFPLTITPSPVSAVPEPASAGLIALTAGLLLCRTRPHA